MAVLCADSASVTSTRPCAAHGTAGQTARAWAAPLPGLRRQLCVHLEHLPAAGTPSPPGDPESAPKSFRESPLSAPRGRSQRRRLQLRGLATRGLLAARMLGPPRGAPGPGAGRARHSSAGSPAGSRPDPAPGPVSSACPVRCGDAGGPRDLSGFSSVTGENRTALKVGDKDSDPPTRFVRHDCLAPASGDFGELAFLHDPEYFFLKKKSKQLIQDIRGDIRRRPRPAGPGWLLSAGPCRGDPRRPWPGPFAWTLAEALPASRPEVGRRVRPTQSPDLRRTQRTPGCKRPSARKLSRWGTGSSRALAGARAVFCFPLRPVGAPGHGLADVLQKHCETAARGWRALTYVRRHTWLFGRSPRPQSATSGGFLFLACALLLGKGTSGCWPVDCYPVRAASPRTCDLIRAASPCTCITLYVHHPIRVASPMRAASPCTCVTCACCVTPHFESAWARRSPRLGRRERMCSPKRRRRTPRPAPPPARA